MSTAKENFENMDMVRPFPVTICLNVVNSHESRPTVFFLVYFTEIIFDGG